ncbi:MAG: hypothetical protein ACFFG0_03720 [Candidatus Thorarchaeota archaeon]
MKIKTEIEIDWIDGDEGDQSIDEIVKGEIINNIVSKISKQLIEKIEKETSEKISSQINNVVDKEINKITNNFLNKNVTITDRWGEKIKEAKITDILKEKFDEFWNTPVDKDGRTSSYGDKKKRIDWFGDAKIKEMGKKYSEDLAKMVNKKVEEVMTDSLKIALGDNIVKKLGVPQIIESIKKN